MVSKSFYIADKKRFLKENSAYSQKIRRKIKVIKLSDEKIKVEFIKEVTINGVSKNSPSCLVFENINSVRKQLCF